MKNKIAILLPYKENYNVDKAGAASIWVKDYLKLSKLRKKTIVYGCLDKKLKPLTKNFNNQSSLDLIFPKTIFENSLSDIEDCFCDSLSLTLIEPSSTSLSPITI